MVFAGYGITAPEYRYDDYAGLDVKGKMVLVLRHEPQENDEQASLPARTLTRARAVHQQGGQRQDARRRGDDPDRRPCQPSRRAVGTGEVRQHGRAAKTPGSRFVEVKEALVDGWFHDAGKSLDTLEADIDKDLKPQSFAFPDAIRVDGQVDIERVVKTVHNVVAYLPGETRRIRDPGGALRPSGHGRPVFAGAGVTAIHPGADDNASGTAGVIELARWFAKQPKQKRGILFLNFAGEEMGLLGSAWYVAHPELPLEKAVAMINMDMIGRMRDGKVYVGGDGERAPACAPLLEKVAPKYPLKVDFSEGPESGSSDHASFITGQVPSLFFFSGLHADYHKPSDTWDKIDAPDAARLLAMVAEVADDLRDEAGRPQFVKAAPVAHGEGAGGAADRVGGRRIRALVRLHSGFRRRRQGRQVRRHQRRLAGVQGRLQGRRRDGGIRRQKDRQPVRFHLRATGQAARRCGAGKGDPRRQDDRGDGAAGETAVGRNLANRAGSDIRACHGITNPTAPRVAARNPILL